jgi:hypothetical protein
MMSMKPARAIVALLLALATTDCAVAPPNAAPTTVTRLGVERRDGNNPNPIDLRHQPGVGRTTIPASLTSVWSELAGVLGQLEIAISHVDAGAGTIGNTGYRARRVEGEPMSRWLDCGRGPVRANADVYEVTLTVLVQLHPADNGTTVQTTVDAYARDRSTSGGSVHCLSWGNLERRVPELVLERLGIDQA